MRLLGLGVGAMMLLVLGLAVIVPAQEIFIWDHDKGADNMFYDPEGAGYVGCEFGVQRALTRNGYTHETLLYLPMDLSQYDVVFVILGWWC
jgi:hypothetical protein